METSSREHGAVLHSRKRQFRLYNVAAIVTMGFGSLSMGYTMNIISSTLAQPSFVKYFKLDTRSDATALISSMNGIFHAGGFFGALAISWVGDRLGRKWSITIPALLLVISSALLAGSVHVGMFLAFRFFSGMGDFWLLGSIPVWMTEIVPPRNRGLLVDIHSAFLLLGFAFASWMGYAWFSLESESAWRGPLALQALPALVVLVAMPWLPESPRFLIQAGRFEEARVVLDKLHEHEEALVEFSQIEAQIETDTSLPHSWMSLVTKRSYRKRALFAIGLACGIQFTGVLVINNYTAIIYGGLGLDDATILLYHAAYNTLAWGCGIFAMFIIDLFPRNKLVAMGSFLVTSCLTIEAALVANFKVGPGQNNAALRAAAAMTFLYITFAQLFLDGTQYVYYAELFPNHLRNKGMSIGMACIALMNVMWQQSAPTAFENIGWKFYLCFIIPGYLFAIACFFLYPNTKGLALEEIASLFGDDIRTDVDLVQARRNSGQDKDSQVSQGYVEHKQRA